jgi:hypothetical protein
MTLKITWKKGPVYPALIKGPAAGIVGGCFLVAGGMSHPWREVEYGFWMGVDEKIETTPSLVLNSQQIKSPAGSWHPLPPLPIGPGWTSGAAVAGGLAVVGGRREAAGMRSTSDVWFLDLSGVQGTWERLADRPAPAMVATTIADGDLLYTTFGTDWQPHEHALNDRNIYRMDVAKRSGWEVVTQFPGKPRWFAGVTVCNGKLYVIGGRDKPVGGVNDIQPYNAHRLDSDGSTVYVAFREVWVCDLENGQWKELERPPRAFGCEAFTVKDRWIVMTGGDSSVVYPEGVSVAIKSYEYELDFLCYSDEVWALDTRTNKWSCLDPLPYGVCSHRVATWNDRVFTIGNEIVDNQRSNAYGTVFEGIIEII